MVVDIYVGFKEMREYSVGNKIEWVPRKTPAKGGRPEGGDIAAEGYTECPICHKDFYATVKVRHDAIIGVEPDLSKKPHIPD